MNKPDDHDFREDEAEVYWDGLFGNIIISRPETAKDPGTAFPSKEGKDKFFEEVNPF